MGNFGIDPYTEGLIETLEKLKLYEGCHILDALNKALSNFGKPNTIMLSLSHHKSFQQMYANVPAPAPCTTQDFIEVFKNVDWGTRDQLPAGLDYRALKDIVPTLGYSKFAFLETLKRLDLGGLPDIWSGLTWTASAEL